MTRAGGGLIVALTIMAMAVPAEAQLGRLKEKVKGAIHETPTADSSKTAKPAKPEQDNGPVNFKTAKIEFVPGERTIFYDDFSDMVEDEPPPHWKVREGKAELWIKG